MSNPSYDASFAELKRQVQDQLPPLPYYNDKYISRFLIARKNDVQKAKEMLLEDVRWRRELDLDNPNKPPPARIEDYFLHHPSGVIGESRDGHPIYYERTGKTRVECLFPQLTQQQTTDIIIFLQEEQRKIFMQSGKDKIYLVMDMEGLDMRVFSKPVLNYLKALGSIDEAHYPETLAKCFIINASTLFSRLWNLSKYFFAPDVREKVIVLGGNYEQTLSQYIDPSQQPRYLKGGSHPCNDPWVGDLSYMNQISKAAWVSTYNKEQIGAGKSFVKEVEVKTVKEGDNITWEFTTEKNNIRFGVWFGPAQGGQPLVPDSKVESEGNMISGSIDVTKPGKYTLVWSNEYSKLTGKTLIYKVLTPNEEDI